MELSSQEGEIPIPINSSTTYGHGNGHGHGLMIHHDHNHIISSTAPSNGIPTMQQEEDHGLGSYKKVVRYRECLKNHAAAMGGNATDGCGEFMPSGEEGTIEALNCSACHCHRNFHRKEVEGEPSCDYHHLNINRRRHILGPHKNLLPPEALGYPTAARSVPPHQMIMPYNIGGIGHHLPSESDEQEDGGGGGGMVQLSSRPISSQQQLVKKRFRTKFSQEQKDKMLNFAEKVGWKIQKQEESVVQQFCQEIGVKRRVLKVWMHNNKHNLAKKNPPTTAAPPPP
ncbi:hypothetical protein AAZX31_07G252800 [Glycine max]|uniref:ZF-HD dimerization-type domain-containing protein n=3 Tax=Glycine subgen. Soja TaxID=1462606 RepID=I1KNQ9_SOYBN|nr:zinc-finger homeodomain protein 4 [Glycine max]XP_028242012.1 zinc-finger homeodomain protein 4-like [Glycine soja]KAG5011362.1 hypothetical protein JHK87_019877 [Glycine soja]KAG5024107.1 hypothetical protein JHK85_020449 [Glycine max]KAG5039182.1 hypothetical protein JHK86_020022 [Glycine max]KAG5144304.1 hypothetical protein JHK82_019999 [Glycine max]KAH1088918.1 hypothetical protein GYH30_019744 [Glycine max]|eukprot:XP_006584131.1 zinc-finger homeodomain protein 4 [Glycine max]